MILRFSVGGRKTVTSLVSSLWLLLVFFENSGNALYGEIWIFHKYKNWWLCQIKCILTRYILRFSVGGRKTVISLVSSSTCNSLWNFTKTSHSDTLETHQMTDFRPPSEKGSVYLVNIYLIWYNDQLLYWTKIQIWPYRAVFGMKQKQATVTHW